MKNTKCVRKVNYSSWGRVESKWYFTLDQGIIFKLKFDGLNGIVKCKKLVESGLNWDEDSISNLQENNCFKSED